MGSFIGKGSFECLKLHLYIFQECYAAIGGHLPWHSGVHESGGKWLLTSVDACLWLGRLARLYIFEELYAIEC